MSSIVLHSLCKNTSNSHKLISLFSWYLETHVFGCVTLASSIEYRGVQPSMKFATIWATGCSGEKRPYGKCSFIHCAKCFCKNIFIIRNEWFAFTSDLSFISCVVFCRKVTKLENSCFVFHSPFSQADRSVCMIKYCNGSIWPWYPAKSPVRGSPLCRCSKLGKTKYLCRFAMNLMSALISSIVIRFEFCCSNILYCAWTDTFPCFLLCHLH